MALPTVVEFLRGKNITVDDNPNARVDEEVADLLINEFKSDKAQKDKSQELTNNRVKPKPAPAPAPAAKPVEEIKVESQINRPKILGKIELDRHGMPVRPKAETPEPEKKAPETPATPAPAPAPVAEKPVPQPAPKAEAPKASAPAVKPAVAETPAPKAPAAEAPAKPKPAPVPAAKKPEPKPAPAQHQKPKPAAAPVAEASKAAPAKKQEVPAPEKEEIFSLGLPQDRPTINVVGKIDLSAINQSTRPKKKSKE